MAFREFSVATTGAHGENCEYAAATSATAFRSGIHSSESLLINPPSAAAPKGKRGGASECCACRLAILPTGVDHASFVSFVSRPTRALHRSVSSHFGCHSGGTFTEMSFCCPLRSTWRVTGCGPMSAAFTTSVPTGSPLILVMISPGNISAT